VTSGLWCWFSRNIGLQAVNKENESLHPVVELAAIFNVVGHEEPIVSELSLENALIVFFL